MPANQTTYLDSNSGAPLHPEVLKALRLFLAEEPVLLANPSSQHPEGRRAQALIERSKHSILKSLHADSAKAGVTFCSSGTDANQTAIRSALQPHFERGEKVHWVTSPVEHSCVRGMEKWVRAQGGEVSYLPVEKSGRIAVEKVIDLIRPGETRLLSLIWVGNETGITSHIQNLKSTLPKSCQLHLDGVAAWGKVEIDWVASGADFLALSGHKVGALSGTGILVHSPHSFIDPVFPGSQQGGRRGGTENVLGILTLGAAASTIEEQLRDGLKTRAIRDELEQWIEKEIPQVIVNGKSLREDRVDHHLSLTFPGYGRNLSIAATLDVASFSVSSGSACASGAPEPSHVMMALGYSKIDALNSLRITLHSGAEMNSCLQMAHELKKIITKANALT